MNIAFGIAGTILAIAAFATTSMLWPESAGYLGDAGRAADLAARAQALTVGGLAVVASAVCWVGYALTGQAERRG